MYTKWTKDLKVRVKPIKLLQGDIGVSLCLLRLGDGLLDAHLTASSQSKRIGRLAFVKMINFCALEHMVQKVRRRPPKWEKVFANPVSDKGLIPRVYTELFQLSTEKTVTPLKNRQRTGANIPPNKMCRWPTST